MRHTSQWWSERVAEFAQTGNARAVARRHGVNERTLVWWRSELRRRAREGTGPRLLPVVVGTAPPRVDAGHADELEVFVEVGVARMTMRGAMSPEHLAAIVSASTRTC
jgi:transposase-like protein